MPQHAFLRRSGRGTVIAGFWKKSLDISFTVYSAFTLTYLETAILCVSWKFGLERLSTLFYKPFSTIHCYFPNWSGEQYRLSNPTLQKLYFVCVAISALLVILALLFLIPKRCIKHAPFLSISDYFEAIPTLFLALVFGEHFFSSNRNYARPPPPNFPPSKPPPPPPV